MPGNHGGGAEDDQGGLPPGPRAAQGDPDASVGPTDRRAGSSAPVHGQRLPEGAVLERESSVPAREDGQQAKSADDAGAHDEG